MKKSERYCYCGNGKIKYKILKIDRYKHTVKFQHPDGRVFEKLHDNIRVIPRGDKVAKMMKSLNKFWCTEIAPTIRVREANCI